MTELNPHELLREANLQDVKGSSLTAHIPELLAADTPHFLVEYGVRTDDHAMVFHFFHPKDKEGWEVDFPERLTHAINRHFDVSRVSAGYVKEMGSFCVIVGSLGGAPDPWPLVERFLACVDAGPGGNGTPAES